MGDQLSRMENWDRISQQVAQLNQTRSYAEAESIQAIDSLLESIAACKSKLAAKEESDSIEPILAELLAAAGQSELSSKKRDEKVLNSVAGLKDAVSNVLDSEDVQASLGLSSSDADDVALIDSALMWHFVHEGFLNTAKTFSKEAALANLPESDVLRVRSGLQAVEVMMKRHDVAPSIAWLEEYASTTSLNVLFDLHKLRFHQLAASQTEAIGYAQRNFARFAGSRSQEIQTLLGGLLFQGPGSVAAASQGGKSVQLALNDTETWENVKKGMLCEIRRPYGSISTLVETGLRSLGELKTYQKLVGEDNKITPETWKEGKELPVQIESAAHYHSEFCCPVSQEQTDNQNNPPMLLVCGHVIAKNSITRIAKHRTRFKCPTCPTEQSVEAPTPIQF